MQTYKLYGTVCVKCTFCIFIICDVLMQHRPHLTSTESGQRVQGTRLLSDVVQALPGEQLKETEGSFKTTTSLLVLCCYICKETDLMFTSPLMYCFDIISGTSELNLLYHQYNAKTYFNCLGN